MQVKKFEAKSMKEALEMVKNQLGPEAIILSARDNNRGFGIAGQRSVEVTAAVSEETLRRKQIAESKLNVKNKNKYEQSPARVQKQFIDKAIRKLEDAYLNPPPPPQQERAPIRPLTSQRYIDIGNEEVAAAPTGTDPRARIRTAAQRAFEASRMIEERPQRRPVQQKPQAAPATSASVEDSAQYQSLRQEILQLKGLIENFNKVPQNFVSMHPGADEGLPYELSSAYEKLLRAGISADIAVEILKKGQESIPIPQLKKPALVEAWIAKYILDHTKTVENRLKSKYQVFLGPVGQGKTASLVKLASHLVIVEKKKIAIVTTDSMKVGAAEQLKIYAQILNVPFAVVRTPQDWNVIRAKLSGVDHILVDFPGLQMKTPSETQFVREMLPPILDGGRSVHYVVSALAREEEAIEVASRYQGLGLQDLIVTNLDEAAQHGLIFNFQKKFDLPLHSFGIGSQIPEDFEAATKERVVDLIFKLSKVKKTRGPI